MTLAIVFCGQGTQHPDMLPWLGNSALLDRTLCLLGVTDWRAALRERAWAVCNAHAQVLLTGVALAAWEQLQAALPAPVCVAGYSVGEVAAFSAAGVFDASTALTLASERAACMDACAQQAPGRLLAVSGLPIDALAPLCMRHGAALAIRNGPDSAVLGGPDDALAVVAQRVVALGGRAVLLPVGVPSHTRWMQPAASAFAQRLAKVSLSRPRTVLYSATRGRVLDAAQAAEALSAQIAETVQWDACLDNLHARRPHCVLEVGPGQALSRGWNQRFADIEARSCDDFRSASAVIDWVAGQARR